MKTNTNDADYIKETIHSKDSPGLIRLREIIASGDRQSAKIFCFAKRDADDIYREVVFIKKHKTKSDFVIGVILNKFDMSISGKLYTRERVVNLPIIYKDGKLWQKSAKHFSPLSIGSLRELYENSSGIPIPKTCQDKVVEQMRRIKYIETFLQYPFLPEYAVTYNSAIRNKNLSFKNRIEQSFKINGPAIYDACGGDVDKIASLVHHFKGSQLHYMLKGRSKYLIKDTKINLELLENPYLKDTIKMLSLYGKYTDLSWSQRRLMEEHDAVSKILTGEIAKITNVNYNIPQVMFELEKAFCEKLAPMNVKVIKSSRELVTHAQELKHCAATYSGEVERGSSFIFNFGDKYTMQVSNQFYNLQFRGLQNGLVDLKVNTKAEDVLAQFRKDRIDLGQADTPKNERDFLGIAF